MTRFAMSSFVVTCVAVLLALVGGESSAAPIPKDASKDDTPDLKAFFEGVSKSVKDEKWPAEADEKKLVDTTGVAFTRMLKAAEQKERGLPVDFPKLTKLDVTGEYKGDRLNSKFLMAGEVRVASAKNSIIFASSDFQAISAVNCVIVAKNVRCTAVMNCFIVADEYIRLNGAERNKEGDPSVLLAGRWIRTTGMDGTICHVLHPSGQSPPDEKRPAGNRPNPAIRSGIADNVIYLNGQGETGAISSKNSTYLPQKNPIAK